MTALRFVLVTSILACARADHPDPVRTKAESNQAAAAGSDAMTHAQTDVTCDAAKQAMTIFLNPENQAVAYISLYVPTTVDEYARRLRPPREKRPR